MCDRRKNGGIWFVSFRQNKSPEPSSVTVPRTAIVSGNQYRLQELAGTKPEAKAGTDTGILLLKFAGNQEDLAVSRRTSSTWVCTFTRKISFFFVRN